MKVEKSVKPFNLNTTDKAFQQRQKNVFDQLSILEQGNSSKAMEVDEPPEECSQSFHSNRRIVPDKELTKIFKGKESIFKKPLESKARILKNMPDFQRNPHKWTKYSLEDVKDEDISEDGNRRAAMSFLKEMEERKNKLNKSETLEDLPDKIVFNKQIKASTKSNPIEEKSSFQGSKSVMPEYVVGASPKVRKDTAREKTSVSKELKLDHLYENDEEEE